MTDNWVKIVLEGQNVTLPRLLGKPDVFSAVPFYLEKPRWTPDEEASTCHICDLKFTQIKRKHHCRNCGRIFCSKCCNFKVPLPHFGLDDVQKVCSVCHPITELIAKSRGQYVTFKQEAATGLLAMTKNMNSLIQLVECGGIQTLIYLAAQGDNVIKEAVAISLHILAQQIPLLPLLRTSGAIKALKHFLINSNDQSKILIESLSALSLFCTTAQDKMLVLQEGATEPLFTLLQKNDTVSLLAARTICSLVENPDHHTIFLNDISVFQKLLNSLKTTDMQKQDIIMKILAYLSTSNEMYRHRLVQEDQAAGYPILNTLKTPNLKSSLLISAVCLVGNLATNLSDQNALQSYLTAVTNLLDTCNEGPAELMTHISRTLANFAEFPPSSLLLVQRLPSIVAVLLRSDVEIHRKHAFRTIIALGTNEPTITTSALIKDGVDTFLEEIFTTEGVCGMLTSTVIRKSSRLSFPR